MIRVLGAAAIAAGLMVGSAIAETCGGTYVVKRGDSLSLIADRLYKNAGLWTAIHTNNIAGIGQNPNSIRVGQRLSMTCIGGLPTGLAGGTVTAAAPKPKAENVVTRASTSLLGTPQLPRIKLITGDDFAPFTDRGLEQGGLLNEVVDAAMTAAVGTEGYETFWINDWTAHTETLLPGGVMEATFPWAMPDCNATPDHKRCVSFHASEPMFEYLVLLFVDRTRPIPFATDADIVGRTICRPEGYMLHMLDQDGRNWVSESKINLVQPLQVKDCFAMLTNGEVDGVILNEFTARDAIKAMDLKDRVEAVQSRPISITSLHALIHKTHPQAFEVLDSINAGLDAIKKDGQYAQIVRRHMEAVWAQY